MTPQEAWLRVQAMRAHRLVKGMVGVSKRHLPKWMVAIVTIALLIPGPQDELLVLVILGVFAAFKPAMRADIRKTTSEAWNIF
ncbi:hypothetical protein SEA_ACOLYTE_90 [Mycobacterium phage Acolyte]|nr:hypothetical protein SEA_ACOLYTE_90 [Mycobacterium phage Acolyte]